MDFQAKVAEIDGMASVRQGVVSFTRALVDALQDALNRNDFVAARRIADDADTYADDVGAAVEANTQGGRQAQAAPTMTREQAMAQYGLVPAPAAAPAPPVTPEPGKPTE